MANFNIQSRAVAASTFLQLTDPSTDEKLVDDNGAAVGINLFGKASKQYRAALGELSRKNMQRKGKTQSFQVNVDDNTDLLAAISDSAVNFDNGGETIVGNAGFVKLYSDPSLFWIKDQVQAALEDTAAFTQK